MKLLYSHTRNALKMLGKQLEKPQFSKAKYFILADQNTFEYCLPDLISYVEPLQEAEFFLIEPGESQKTLSMAEELWVELLKSQADRSTVIVNLGGGVVSDLGGFIAAAYKRGIQYINVPTTLLGMVDAAIGGKTAVDMGELKNQIGFFHLPLFTCIYPPFLETLPIRELKAGAAEMLKSALIADADFWKELQIDEIAKAATIPQNIFKTAEIKQKIVKADFQEKHLRKALNFGHTIGHGIESYLLFSEKPLLHGEAVALGMLSELYLSVKKLKFPKTDFKEIEQYIQANYDIRSFSAEEIEQILEFIKHDKKSTEAKINACLLHAIGNPAIDIQITEKEAFEAIDYLSKIHSS